jgi:hypothetical protein
MKFNVSWVGRSPIDLTEPQHAAALLRIVFDVMERVEPLTDFQFELAGNLCVAEYEVLTETLIEPPEEYVCVRLGWAAPGAGVMGQSSITEDGRPGVHFELEEDDFKDILLDSDAISWRI